ARSLFHGIAEIAFRNPVVATIEMLQPQAQWLVGAIVLDVSRFLDRGGGRRGLAPGPLHLGRRIATGKHQCAQASPSNSEISQPTPTHSPHLPPITLATLMPTGNKTTRRTTGKMNKPKGKLSLTGSLLAFSSARKTRFS